MGREDHEAQSGQPWSAEPGSAGDGSVTIWQITHHRRREADRLSRREEAFWTLQRLEIQRRLADIPPSPMPSAGGESFAGRDFGRAHSRPAFRFMGPALISSAVAAALMVVTFSSLGPWSGPSDPAPAPELRSTAELRGLFADIGQSLARTEPVALAPAVPVRQALEAAWSAEHRRADSPWNTTVKLHAQKEL